MGLCCRCASCQPWCFSLALSLLPHACLVVAQIKKTGPAVCSACTRYAGVRMLRYRKLSPSPGRSTQFTLPVFRHTCYEAGSDEFSWSMTHDEVRWHAYRLTQRVKVTLVREGDAETLFANNLTWNNSYTADQTTQALTGTKQPFCSVDIFIFAKWMPRSLVTGYVPFASI